MFRPNVDASATRTDEPGATLTSPAFEADLELRVVRLGQLVAGFEQVLERFQGASAAFGATVFDNFDDPGVSNDALDLLFASSTDARRDLAVLRRDAPTLVAAPDSSAEHPLLRRLGLLGESAAALGGRFEEYGRSMDLAVPPRTPGGVGRLNEFVGLIVRALLDIADAMDRLRSDPRRLRFAAGVSARPDEPATPPGRQRSSAGALGMPLAGVALRVLRRRRTRLMVEFAGVVVVGVVILVSALGQGGRTPGLLAGPGAGSVPPGGTGYPGVAIGSNSPSSSAGPDVSTVPRASGAGPSSPSSPAPAPAPPRSTPTPTLQPAPTPNPPAAVTQFGNRTATAATTIDGLLNTITTAVQDADLPTAATAANEIGATATRERTWLQSHPAAACYQSIQDSAMASYGELIVTAAAIAQTAEAGDANAIHPQVASSHGDVSVLRQAGTKAVAACA